MTADFITVARPHRGMIATCMVAAPMLQAIDATIANVALPHMQGTLGASTDQISWVLTSYLIAAAIVTPAMGWLSERLGRRFLFLASVAGFTITSMACGAAQSLEQIVIFRLLQGVFGASLMPLSQAVMLDLYEPHERGEAMALWSTAVMLGPILGPTLGAWLTDTYSWRYVFYINLPVGVLGFIGMWAYLPETARDTARRFEWTGFLALGLGVAALQLVLDRGETKDWFSSAEIVVEATLSAIGFYLFFVHMALADKPFVTRSILRDRNFVTCLGVQFGLNIVLNSTSALLPPYLQTLAGYPVLLAGLALSPRGLGTIIAGRIVGRFMNKVDPRALMLGGLAALAYSVYDMTLWTPDTSIAEQIPIVMLQGATLSLVFIPLQIVAFATLPAPLRTEATSIIALFRNMGGAVGISVLETLLARNTQVAHADLARFANPFNRPLHTGAAAHFWNTATPHGIAALDSLVNYQAQIIAYRDDFLAMFIGMFPAAVLILLMRRPRTVEEAPEDHLLVE
ncbi:MAG TPA: DHA2 family efflux MFS transporter permease subunit [Acetobacteraceae bacterium]|nr:DHA2 family efflux MFS transporter permease subunit [Acetobacteraceae bacterium]